MKRNLKVLLKLAAALLSVFLIALALSPLALKRYFPPENIRALVADKAAKALGREVRLGGVSLSLLRGLTLEGLAISEAPDFKAGTFAQARALTLNVDWLPLLRGKVVISKVSVEVLKLEVVKRKDGLFNFSDIASSTASPPDTPVALAVARASLSGAEIRCRDEGTGDELSILGLDAKVGKFRLSGPFDAELSFKVSGHASGRAVDAGIAFAGRLDLGGNDPRKVSAEIKRLAVDWRGLQALAAGSVEGLESPKLDVRATLSSGGSELLSVEFAGTVAPPRAGSALAAEGGFKASTPGFRGSELAALGVPAGLAGFASPAGSVEGEASFRGDDLRISSLRVKTKSGTVDVSGEVKKLTSGRPEPTLDVKAHLDLPSFTSKDIPYGGAPPDLAVPASQWDVSLSGSLDRFTVRSLRIILGRNDVEVSGAASALRAKNPVFSVLVQCRSFALEDLAQFSSRIRELDLAGRGFFSLGFLSKEGKPVVQGRLQFQGLGATVAGLKLAGFAGTAVFDKSRVDIPDLKGKVADGVLDMNLTVNNYATAPDVSFRASLTEFDLGRYLAAQDALAAAEPQAGAAGGTKKSGKPIDARGRLTVGRLIHPNAEAKDLDLSWRLTGIASDLRKLNGVVKLGVGAGSFNSVGKMAKQSAIVKVLVFPFLVFERIGKLGGIRIFPDFNNIKFTRLTGDYSFQNGMMTLNETRIHSRTADVSAHGTIDLPAEKLDLAVRARIERMVSVDVGVTGTFSSPKTKVKMLKSLAHILKN